MLKLVIRAMVCLLPWSIRRWVLQKFWRYQIHPSSKIGSAWVFPKHLILEANSYIGNLTVCKGLDLIHLKESSIIGNGNWITGYPSGSSEFYADNRDRKPQLIIDEHSAITNRHLIDCTDSVTIGKFSTFAGFNSQILSHSINLELCKQISGPVKIGDYCFIGSNCLVLANSSLPDYSVLGAKSLLNKNYAEPYHLYAGVPARQIKPLPQDYLYFSRSTGVVN
jgi:acetyltransferase-like isoleucine patch superfamily enzyme